MQVVRVAAMPAPHEVEPFRHRVLASLAQRLAAQQAPGGEQAAAPGAEAGDRDPCIIGASGVETTTLPEQGAEPAFV